VTSQPYGVYYAGVQDYTQLAGMGVNLVVLPYYRGIRAELDVAYRNGVRVMVIGADWITGEGQYARVRPVLINRQIGQIRDHPALWGYYAVDEPAHRAIPLTVLQQLYASIKQQDARHPVMVVFDQVASFGSKWNPYDRGVCDVVAFDIYTVNTQGYQPWIPYYLPGARDVVAQRTPGTPIWLVAQAFSAGHLLAPSGGELVRQIREGVRYGGIRGVVAFLWDRTWQDRFLDFRMDLRSSADMRRALPEGYRLLARGAG
jgi:hypothetical protein